MTVTQRRITRWIVPVLVVPLLMTLGPSRAGAAAVDAESSRLQRDADALRDAGVTGVSVRLTTPEGARSVRSGVGDLRTGRPVPASGFIRIGSTTKTFVATVVLQLVGEGRLALTDTVDTWLPGVIRGEGNDGRHITVRQLLQHTSGLPDYTADVVPDLSARGYREHRWTTYTSEQRVAFAMNHAPSFEPGTSWEYSNTNYVVLGMLIEAVTGNTWEEEVQARIVDPLRLRDTITPGNWPFLPRPHARNYQQFEPGGQMTDATIAYLPFDGDADGALISTAADTNTFFTALVRGDLLGPAEQAEMQQTVPVPDDHGDPPGSRDGLGLRWTPLSCGGGYWGHSGSGFGYIVWGAATSDGRASITVSLHSRPRDEATAIGQVQGAVELIDRALCR